MERPGQAVRWLPHANGAHAGRPWACTPPMVEHDSGKPGRESVAGRRAIGARYVLLRDASGVAGAGIHERGALVLHVHTVQRQQRRPQRRQRRQGSTRYTPGFKTRSSNASLIAHSLFFLVPGQNILHLYVAYRATVCPCLHLILISTESILRLYVTNMCRILPFVFKQPYGLSC